MQNIIVCVKAVPDPKEAAKIKIDPQTKTLTRNQAPLVLNQLDKHALEAALQLKEKWGATVTVISMGPPPAAEVLKQCLAMGADQGVLLSDRAFAGADAYATAYTLAQGIEKIGNYDLVLCGMESSDGSTAQVGAELSVFLDLPVVTGVQEITETEGENWKLKTRLENGFRLVKVKLPAVLTVTRHLNEPRNISFSGIVKARKKEVRQWDAQELGLAPGEVGLKGSPTIISELKAQEKKRSAEILKGDRTEIIQKLLQRMAEAGVL